MNAYGSASAAVGEAAATFLARIADDRYALRRLAGGPIGLSAITVVARAIPPPRLSGDRSGSTVTPRITRCSGTRAPLRRRRGAGERDGSPSRRECGREKAAGEPKPLLTASQFTARGGDTAIDAGVSAADDNGDIDGTSVIAGETWRCVRASVGDADNQLGHIEPPTKWLLSRPPNARRVLLSECPRLDVDSSTKSAGVVDCRRR